MDIYSLCQKHTDLNAVDIQKLEQIAAILPLISDLSNSDVFINCMDIYNNTALVIAQAIPQFNESAYQNNVVGTYALRQNEPAVYQALEKGITSHDLKAITQEGASVKQDVVPIKGQNGHTIGVLIREKDISHFLRNDKKLAMLIRENNEQASKLSICGEPGDLVNIREIHHRVKNNLQMIISIMNLQMRRSQNEEVNLILREHIQRIMSIATIHEMLIGEQADESISLQMLLNKICRNIKVVSAGSKAINIKVTGDDLIIASDISTPIAIVVNELVSNAIEHGYAQQDSGQIAVNVSRGTLYTTITIQDYGCGYTLPDTKSSSSLGLELVALTVKDKLKGVFRVMSSQNGTKAFFTIKMI